MLPFFFLYNINKVLSKRVRKRSWFYVVLVSLLCFFVSVFIGMTLFTGLVDFDREEDYKAMFSFFVVLVFMFDMLPTIIRVQNKALIEPHHINIFPIGRWEKFLFQLVLLVVDYKSILYLCCSLIFVFLYLKKLAYISALLSAISWILFFLSVATWYIIFFRVAGGILTKYRQHAIALFLVLVIVINTINISKRYYLYSSVPVLSFLGNGLYALTINDLATAIINLFLLALTLAAGLVIVRFLPPGT